MYMNQSELTHLSSQNHLSSSVRFASSSTLRSQLEAVNLYAHESGFSNSMTSSRNRFSDNSHLSGDQQSNRNTQLLNDSIEEDYSDKEEETISSDDEFILQFAKRCSAFPGRKPILLEIENILPDNQKSQLPILLVICIFRLFLF